MKQLGILSGLLRDEITWITGLNWRSEQITLEIFSIEDPVFEAARVELNQAIEIERESLRVFLSEHLEINRAIFSNLPWAWIAFYDRGSVMRGLKNDPGFYAFVISEYLRAGLHSHEHFWCLRGCFEGDEFALGLVDIGEETKRREKMDQKLRTRRARTAAIAKVESDPFYPAKLEVFPIWHTYKSEQNESHKSLRQFAEKESRRINQIGTIAPQISYERIVEWAKAWNKQRALHLKNRLLNKDATPYPDGRPWVLGDCVRTP